MPIPARSGYSFIGWTALPSVYQPVEYIESNSGGEFIDTGFIATSNTDPMMVFTGNWNGSSVYISRIALYRLKISEGNDITNDFIPCYRKSDDAVGLYDMINGQFYGNNGTKAFIKGSNVSVVTSSNKLITNEDHTLYAIWEKN